MFDLLGISEFEKISEEIFIEMSDHSILRILHVSSEKETSYTLLVIAGWASIPLGWNDFLLEAKKNFEIFYLESREKKSSILPQDSINDIERMALDICETVEKLNLRQDKLILFSSSFGTLLTAHALSYKMINPLLTVLIGPIAKVEIKLFKSESEEQAAKYLRVLKEADEVKWKKIGKAIAQKEYWNIYENISRYPTLVIDESNDKMHNTEVTKKITSLIKTAKYVDLHTNYFTHSADMAHFLQDFLKNLEL
ncbi:MAG: hypothetical protein ACTSQ6_07910 [Candidatus Heimdallarchaeaceae archaeon]